MSKRSGRTYFIVGLLLSSGLALASEGKIEVTTYSHESTEIRVFYNDPEILISEIAGEVTELQAIQPQYTGFTDYNGPTLYSTHPTPTSPMDYRRVVVVASQRKGQGTPWETLVTMDISPSVLENALDEPSATHEDRKVTFEFDGYEIEIGITEIWDGKFFGPPLHYGYARSIGIKKL